MKNNLKNIIKRVLIEEDYRKTGWEDEEGRVTVGDVIDYIGDDVVDIPISYLEKELSSQLNKLKLDPKRIVDAELQYPIILVKRNGNFEYVLDGNHRLAKAIRDEKDTIKSKVLDLDNSDVPEAFIRLL